MELVLALEEEFEIDVEGEDVKELTTFGLAVKYIESKVSSGVNIVD